jgi:adenylate cyclase, class 2
VYEVELKFPLPDPADTLAALGGLGATPAEPLVQRDVYFAHPSRDFAATNEALRVRSSGDANVVTYKGPLVDDRTKARREIEIPFANGRAAELEELLAALGFREVRAVEKRRTPLHLVWQGLDVEATLDEVAGLGTFVEIEATANDETLPAVRDAILALAARLGLREPERRSYLEMLLERDA